MKPTIIVSTTATLFALAGVALLTQGAAAPAAPSPDYSRSLTVLRDGALPTVEQQRVADALALDHNAGAERVGRPGRINGSSARIARVDGDRVVLVMGGAASVCIFRLGSARGLACQPTSYTVARAQPVALVDEPGTTSPSAWVDVLIPDAATNVELTFADGDTLAVTATNNVVSRPIEKAVASVSWSDATGARVIAPLTAGS